VIDFVPKVRLKGRVLLVNDDAAFDSMGVSREATAIVLDVKAGKRKAKLVEIFDQTKIGNWNGFAELFLPSDGGIEFVNDDGTAFQFANLNLLEVGFELRVLAQQWFPNVDLRQAVAVLTSIERDPKQDPVAHEDGSDTLASAASFKVVIEFARVRP
jgi:hypothetical protein